MRIYNKFAAAFLILLAISGCVSTYNQRMAPVKKEVKSSNYKKALKEFNKTGIRNQGKNSLLYHFEAGLLYHLSGDYKESNRFLENAEWISDELYTKSISREVATLVTSNKILPYRGEFYEYLFTNYYKLLNYLYLGSLEDALVEVRRINHKLSLFKKDDAFMHYLTAILYQYNRQDSDAFIEYKKAYNAYKKIYPKSYGVAFPKQLSKDIAVFCKESRFSRCNEFPKKVLDACSTPAKYGSAVFIMETGFVPYKYEERIEAAIPHEYKKKHPEKFREIYYLTVALPRYAPNSDYAYSVTLELNGKTFKMDMVEDLGAMAKKTLEQEQPKILTKAIVRAAAKYVAYRKVKGKKTGDDKKNLLRSILGTSVNIFGAATEGADTRSWLTLPNRIFMSRHYLEPGKYSFKLTLDSVKGVRKTTPAEDFTIKQGEIKFIILRQF